MGDRITFLGHSTVLLELAGARLLTDPVLRSRVLHLRRHGPAPAPEALHDLDGILISHLHGDHFDPPSLRMLDRATPVVVPRGAGATTRGLGFTTVHEVDAGQTVELAGVPVRAVHADHDERRWPQVRPDGHAGRLRRRHAAARLLRGRHGRLRRDARRSGTRGVDVALLPVWGWGPTLGPGPHGPGRARRRRRALLRPRVAVPIHWGTLYPIGVHRVRPKALALPPRMFAGRVAHLAPEVDVRILRPGEALDVEAAMPASPRAPTR